MNAFLVAAVIGFTGAIGSASAQDDGVRAFHDRFFQAWNEANLAVLEQSLSEDTVYHPMNGASLVGREAVVSSYRALLASNVVKMTVTPEVLDGDGTAGTMSGLYSATLIPKDGASAVERSGRYFMVLRQQAGVWRIVREITQPTGDTVAVPVTARAANGPERQPVPDGAGYAKSSRPWELYQPKVMKRRFADIAEGQVHYWQGGKKNTRRPPLIFMHPGPQTARVQVPLLDILAETRQVFAPDLMGMGDSSPPRTPDGADPGLDYYADAALRFADAVGIKEIDLMGSSLGGYVAVEMALQQPGRAKRLIINRLNIMNGEMLDAFTAYHGPKVVPDQQGLYVMFLWSRLKDLYTYVPWFRHDAANLRGRGLPPPEIMHIAFTEQVKMATTQYLAFNAYWRYPIADRFAQLKLPVMAGSDGAVLLRGAKAWAPNLSGDVLEVSEDELRAYAAEAVEFLDGR